MTKKKAERKRKKTTKSTCQEKAVAKKAPAKKAASKKTATKKAPAKKKVAKKKAVKKAKYTPEQVYAMTEQAAYFAALNDGFSKEPGEYWSAAEAEISSLL